MPKYPFNYSSGRAYYGSALPNQEQPEQQFWVSNQPRRLQQNPSGVVGFGLGTATLFGAGFIPTGQGKRVFDSYTRIIRSVEEYSPAAMLRTFQLSPFVSQFSGEARKTMRFTAAELRSNRGLATYFDELIGKIPGKHSTYHQLAKEGLRLEGGKLYWGKSQRVALKYASSILDASKEQRLGAGWARSVGAGIAGVGQLDESTNLYRQVIGARNPFQYAYRQAAVLGTEYVSRFNRLLQSPFELEPFRTVFSKAEPLIKNRLNPYGFGVKPGRGLNMLGRLAGKYGLVAGGLFGGYQTLDWAVRNTDILNDTGFDQGLTAGIGTLGVKANLMASQIAESTGLHAYREKQEEIAPGSTSLQKMFAFPIAGALLGATSAYGAKVLEMAKEQILNKKTAAQAREIVEEKLGNFQGTHPLNKLARKFTDPKDIYAGEGKLARFLQRVAKPVEKGTQLSYKFLGKLGPAKLAGLAMAGIGAAATLPFLPGALIPSTRPDELKRIYSGEQEVAIRKGRWWEFGRSPYEGRRIMYHRPHWYPRMMMRAREKGIYGEYEDELSPFQKWWKREMTYDLEKQHYYSRPYPITALPFEDVPLVGPLLAATVGRMVKPPKLMHTEEWTRNGEVLLEPGRYGERLATEIGEKPGPAPMSPYDWRGTVGEQAYRMTEMIGLPGFVMTSVKEQLTGTPELFDQYKQLESARRMAGAERAYWDQEIGGGLGATEALRRLYPHRRRQIPLYNPIRNLMPEWLPGPGEKAPDLLHGDPYTKVQEGELRLPGAGYEARFPELKGVSPEEYPLIHQFRILADVGPYTDKFKLIERAVRGTRKTDKWNEYQEKIYQTTMEQVAAKKKKMDFQEYQYLSPMGEIFDNSRRYGGEDSSALISKLNEIHSDQEEGKKASVFTRIFGGYWEMISHNIETSLDQLTPASPGAKLVHQRTAIEQYQTEQVYGTQNAFWSHPIRDFIRPFTYLSAKSLGLEDVPSHVQHKRNLEEYFDVLDYVKNARLANMARASDDREALKEFEAKKDQTLFGINPFTRNYRSIFRALPRRERDYFNAFAEAETTEERAEILKIVPENEKALYIARWKLALADDIKRAKKKDLLSEKELEEADVVLDEVYDEVRSEGFPTSQELFAEYVSTRLPGENYGDWYRRTKLLPQVETLPGPDWVGWHPSVDLEDVKLKVVQNMGQDMHDYDLWPSRAHGLEGQEYLDEEAIRQVMQPEELTNDQIHDRINELISPEGIRPQIFTSTRYGIRRPETIVDVEQDVDLEPGIKGLRS